MQVMRRDADQTSLDARIAPSRGVTVAKSRQRMRCQARLSRAMAGVADAARAPLAP